MTDSHSVVRKAASSVKWSALMEVVSRTASPIVLVILARLLTPQDFGVVATAMIAISFAQMFWEAGLGRALVQTREAPGEAANVVFWANLALGIVAYAVLFLVAPSLAVFFNSPASMPVLRVLGLQVVIGSLTVVQQSLFVRDFDFRQLFWVKLATAFVPGAFSIPLAFFGHGVWALVAGSLAGSLLNLALLWRRSAWRPHMSYDFHLARKLFGFGVWVVGESLGAWLIVWGDNLVVGRFLGIEELGVYRVGWSICGVIFGLLLSPFLPVLYPTFSRLQEDRDKLIETFHKANRAIVTLSLPTGTGLLLVGPQVASVLFGDKWQGLGLVLSIVGLTLGLTWMVGINTELYRAMGRPDVNTKLLLVTVLVYLPVYWWAAQLGLEVFVLARLSVGLVGILLQVCVCVHLLGVSPFYLWHQGRSTIVATLAMAFAVMTLKWFLPSGANGLPELLMIVLLVTTGVAVYGGMLWLLDRVFVVQIKDLLKRVALT